MSGLSWFGYFGSFCSILCDLQAKSSYLEAKRSVSSVTRQRRSTDEDRRPPQAVWGYILSIYDHLWNPPNCGQVRSQSTQRATVPPCPETQSYLIPTDFAKFQASLRP